MKEVTIKRFEKGDLIKGKEGNGYGITNGDMTRAVVTGVDNGSGMTIKGLEFKSGYKSDAEFRVANDPTRFELLPKVNSKASEDINLNIAVCVEKGSELVSAVITRNKNIYAAHAECSPHDVFDLRIGAALAIDRAFALMEQKADEPKEPDGPVKIGDLVRVVTPFTSGGLKADDLTEVIGIGTPGRGDKPYVYVASKTESCYAGDSCHNPGRGTLKQPFTYLNPREYDVLPEQPVRPGRVE